MLKPVASTDINQNSGQTGPDAATVVPGLMLHVSTRNHGLVPPATSVERKKRHLAKPRREEQCAGLDALHRPRLAGAARSLPSPPATWRKGWGSTQVHHCIQDQPQELFIVPWEVMEDVDVNGREIQTRCPRALSKQVHINVLHSSQPELRCVKPLWLPKDQCDSVKPATEQGKGFLLTNWIGASTKGEQCVALGQQGRIVRASARSGHRCQSHCSALSPSARRPELLTPAGHTHSLRITPAATSTKGGETSPATLLDMGADGGRVLLQAQDVFLVFPTSTVNPKLLPQPYCCCYYETKSTITAFFQCWLEQMYFASKGFCWAFFFFLFFFKLYMLDFVQWN